MGNLALLYLTGLRTTASGKQTPAMLTEDLQEPLSYLSVSPEDEIPPQGPPDSHSTLMTGSPQLPSANAL